jgi:hypothetical protein
MKRTLENLFYGWRERRARADSRARECGTRRLNCERLEDRRLLTAVPFGAYPDDTGEYMLGDVLVTVVLMESNNNVSSVNPNTENWTPALIAATKQKVQTGSEWWEQTLAAQFPNSPHDLDFHFDFTYADNPVPTNYEPISQISNYFQYWMYDFLNPLGYNQFGNFSDDIRAFNHAQRLAHDTDWAFTVFVVNDTVDGDKRFAYGGSFPQAFSYAGGQFMVSPASRPASTFAHETGHMFWARDEYPGGGSYTDRRGYYDTQNWNAADNPTAGFQQVISIMTSNSLLDSAYQTLTSSPTSLAMIGWQDSDGDGVFDVLDVPHTLAGTGYLDPASSQYRFVGVSSVQTLPNLNTSGLQNDITLNEISRAEYRVDGGSWQTAATFGTPVAELNLSFPVPTLGTSSVEIRTVDAVSGVTSPVFQGDTSKPTSVLHAGLNGFVWNDLDGDAALENDEARLAGWTVRLVDGNGSPLNLVQMLEPDGYATGMVLNTAHPQATLSVSGGLAGTVVAAAYGSQKVFGNRLDGLGTSATWKPGEAGMRVDFATPVTTVRVDAIGTVTGDRARLEAYDRFGILIGRYTTRPLADGQLETMQIQRPTPDIAYVIADAHSGISVRLDRLRFGPESAVKTDAQGAYAIRGLVAGQYLVEAVSPSGRVLADSRREVTLAEGGSIGSVDIVAHTGVVSWQNPIRPTDVNGDDDVTALDALLLINYINAHNTDVSLPANELPPPYLDVDGNGLVTAADVLAVINQLNSAATSSSGAGGESGESAFAEGESPDVVDLTMLSPSFAASLTATTTRADGDADQGTAMATLDLPPGGSGSGPSRLHHVVPRVESPSPVRAASTSRYVIANCEWTVPPSPAEGLVADELPGVAELEDLLSMLAEDLTQALRAPATA